MAAAKRSWAEAYSLRGGPGLRERTGLWGQPPGQQAVLRRPRGRPGWELLLVLAGPSWALGPQIGEAVLRTEVSLGLAEGQCTSDPGEGEGFVLAGMAATPAVLERKQVFGPGQASVCLAEPVNSLGINLWWAGFMTDP